MNLSDHELQAWASEHLLHEAEMLVYSTVQIDAQPEREGKVALLESFAVHARCLHDFLWHDRGRHAMDAFAADFCDPGAWERTRGHTPPYLAEIRKRNRFGREVAHLSYHRSSVAAETKHWQCGMVTIEIAQALSDFAELALPTRLSPETRTRLGALLVYSPSGGVDLSGAICMPTAAELSTGKMIPLEDLVGGS